MLHQLAAVLAAWAGDVEPLAMLLPERPVFLTDLTPPAAHLDDPVTLRAQLAALARGDWRSALATAGEGPRADAARAIAHERVGDFAAAIAAWDRVLVAGEDERARLARGSLHARAGRYQEAERDLARAGDSFAARWDRGALLVIAAADGDGALDAARIARARAEAGEPSAYWSDPTVGRLLWSRTVERTLAATRHQRPANDAERARLRAAERELEHDTFWDRALLLVGWSRVGAKEEAARIAEPLATAEARAIGLEPAFAAAPGFAEASRRLADRALPISGRAIVARKPGRARRALAPLLSRDDLRRFRLPCVRCGRGSIGVEEVREASPAGA